jgi:hypothetical protein
MQSATPDINQQLRAANELLLRVLQDESSDQEIAFICECERPDCYAALWLTRAAYEVRLAASQPIVLPGHLVPAPSSARDPVPLREQGSTSARRLASPRRATTATKGER